VEGKNPMKAFTYDQIMALHPDEWTVEMFQFALEEFCGREQSSEDLRMVAAAVEGLGPAAKRELERRSRQAAFFGSAPQDPLLQWWEEEMEIDGNATVRCTAVWLSLEDWCKRTGNLAVLEAISHPNKLTRALEEAIPGLCLRTFRRFGEGGWRYRGIRFKSEATANLFNVPNLVWGQYDGSRRKVRCA
jgi:hypothetical protein